MNYKIINKNCLEALDELDANSIDCIITDPPYELNFMNKGWDNAGVSFNKETWSKCLRVLKDGGYLLAFGGTRTYHRIACAIEDAGFEIRDCIMWLYGSGFPKSTDISKQIDKKFGAEREIIGHYNGAVQTGITGGFNASESDENGRTVVNITLPSTDLAKHWQGWGTALKPAYEPIIVARKRFKGSLVDNVLKNGVGGLNIDECRVQTQDDLYRKPCENGSIYSQQEKKYTTGTMSDSYKLGRFPANVILDTNEGEYWRRYFYCAKASKKDRDEGLDEFEKDITDDGRNKPIDNPFLRGETLRKNTHPTVKPTELMQYLVRLVAPKNATILDCFMGSGSTGKAVAYENKERNMNYTFIGIELDPEYCKIAEARIKHVIIKM